MRDANRISSIANKIEVIWRKTAAGYKWKYTHGADNLDSIGD